MRKYYVAKCSQNVGGYTYIEKVKIKHAAMTSKVGTEQSQIQSEITNRVETSPPPAYRTFWKRAAAICRDPGDHGWLTILTDVADVCGV